MTQKKALPLLNVRGLISMFESIDNMHKNASNFPYPFLMMQGELDDVVSNRGASSWYANVSDKIQKEKVMFAGQVHELHKEPAKLEVT